MTQHALLSASSAHRWIHCPPSARLNAVVVDKPSDYAAEGTDAHALCERRLREALKWKDFYPSDICESLTWYSEEMEECAGEYAAFIREIINREEQSGVHPTVFIEERVDFSRYVPDGFGTADCIILANHTLYVIDFKYGQGVTVDAADNPQMMLYALGALTAFDGLYDIITVSMTIFQPRRENISTQEIRKEHIYHWAQNTLRPAAEMAYEGTGSFAVGEHCRFCRVKAQCRARAEHNLTMAQYDFRPPDLLEDEEIDNILSRINELADWAESVRAYALDAAVRGKHWGDWKLVAGRSVRRYISEESVAQALLNDGVAPDVFYKPQELLGITAMEKALGRQRFAQLISPYIEKPPGKPTLVPRSDKREELSSAATDFAEPLPNEKTI
jgi:hypothetical protein